LAGAREELRLSREGHAAEKAGKERLASALRALQDGAQSVLAKEA
jgi:hypothetical protein